MQRIQQYRDKTIYIEHEFEYELIPGFPKIRGHIDWITQTGNREVTIIDHKTNRQPKQLEKWMDDLQTICYGWATRQLLGNDWTINFKIGYVNLPYDANWNVPLSFDDTLRTWFRRSWSELLEMEEKGKFKRYATDTCKYCPLSGNCEVERKSKKTDHKLLSETLRILHNES